MISEGSVYGKWTVLNPTRVKDRDGKIYRVLCRCVCGTERMVNYQNMKRGGTKSCGCQEPKRRVKLPKEGDRTFHLTFKGEIKKEGKSEKWLMLCDCGTEKWIWRASLWKEGGWIEHTKSCGCLNSKMATDRNTSHGQAHTRVYKIWQGMKIRCTSSNFPDYQGRGITFCPEWETFEGFYEDMGDPPSSKHTLDRIDNDKGYFKENCRWSTMHQQNRNKRNNFWITHNGETKILQDWALSLGISSDVLRARINKLSWTVEKALTTPVRKINKLNKGNKHEHK